MSMKNEDYFIQLTNKIIINISVKINQKLEYQGKLL